ncbi:asparagine synthetase B family protein [Thiocystis violacea]|uniref:asparagine synthetase B family protein n=1 Tax=Thiocystis violacea TaxID=13725 RepID=UPI001906F984|nr:asparagine synthase-related protein [Thiocystis violacea]MBK1724853.1 asparagine synthase [Thiocystis violacea]
MRDFCGWLDSRSKPQGVLRATVAALMAGRGYTLDDPSVRVMDGAVMAVMGPMCVMAEKEGVLALMSGRPVFSEPPPSGEDAAMTLLRLWRAHGPELTQRVHGSFAFAILDAPRQDAFLAVDRIGIQTMAFARSSEGLIFSNRADLVADHPDLAADLDPQGIFDYLYFSMVPAPGTIFRSVEKLLPAQWVRYRAGNIERGFYWHLAYRDEPRRDFEEQADHFRRLLREGVERARGTDEVAAFLSGGIDSSTVAGLLTGVQGQPARTYSIGFEAEGFDEMEYARIVARHFGLDACEYYLTPKDVLDAIPRIAHQYDEPFANESAVSAYFCAKLAADDGYRVMLGGDGGDEILGGNERYAKQKVFEFYSRIPGWIRSGLIEPAIAYPWMDRLMPGRKLKSYVHQANTPLPDRMEAYNFFHRQPLNEMFTPEFLAQVDPERPIVLLRDPYERADSQHFINRMLHLDLKFTLADNDLRKVSAMAEVAGVEVRYPLLDDALVEFSGQVPPDWKVKGQYLRWFVKRSLNDYLPEAIIKKSKHGFGLPFGIWLRDDQALAERVRDRLTDLGRRGWLRPDYIARIQTEHQTLHATYFGKMLWVMLMLEEWVATRDLG